MKYGIQSIQKFYKDNNQYVHEFGVITGSFWLLSFLCQRLNGFIGIHGGRSALVMTTFGLFSTTTSLLSSSYINNYAKVSKRKHDKTFYVKSTLLGLLCFSVLEGKLFRSMIPSSVITTGVMTNLFLKNRQSIISTSPIATDVQRSIIQKIGKRFGCHHCGSRQLFSKKIFIADHMPPTKIYNEINNKWWRKILNLKTSQRLYAQCFKCYLLQGSAVKSLTHVPVYHSGFYLYHFAPFIAINLLKIEDIDRSMTKIAESLLEDFQKIEKYINRLKIKRK